MACGESIRYRERSNPTLETPPRRPFRLHRHRTLSRLVDGRFRVAKTRSVTPPFTVVTARFLRKNFQATSFQPNALRKAHIFFRACPLGIQSVFRSVFSIQIKL